MTKRRKKITTLYLAVLGLVVFGLMVLSSNLSVSASDISDLNLTKNISLYFFYGEGCPHCIAIKPIVNTICKEYEISLKSYEVFYNVSNRALFMNFSKRYCIPENECVVPMIFVGEFALIGDREIVKNLKDAVIQAKEKGIHAETYERKCTTPKQPPELLTIATIIGAAIIDSINPCAIGVLIIFITFMISSANFSIRRIAAYGIIYIMFIYITYFLAGIGVLKFLNFMHNPEFIISVNTLVIAILSIGAFLAFRDMYISLKKNEKKKLYLAIPSSAKGTLEKYIKKGTLPAVIILGILVAMVELPCTGQVYLGILTILNTIDFNYGILLLAVYNLIFVLPLIIILSIVLLGKNLSESLKTKTERSWLVRYLIGWLMLILAMFLINENLKLLNFTITLPITLSYVEFFIFTAILIIVLFTTFSVLRPIVKKRINIWYCAYCYACTLTWSFLTILYMLGVDVPKILIGTLIGMSLAGIWEEFKKFNFKYFGLFTIFLTIFGITLIYAFLNDYKFEFLLLVLMLFAMDGIIILKNFEIKEPFEKEKIKEIKSLREMLDHCCD